MTCTLQFEKLSLSHFSIAQYPTKALKRLLHTELSKQALRLTLKTKNQKTDDIQNLNIDPVIECPTFQDTSDTTVKKTKF